MKVPLAPRGGIWKYEIRNMKYEVGNDIDLNV